MKKSSHNLAVLFIDICGSTKLFEEVGDHRALSLTTHCLARMEALIGQGGGLVQETRGDGILCSFASVDLALQAAQAIREALQSDPLSVHAGIHFGRVIPRAGNIYGDAVNVAARMVDLAKDTEIILSQNAFEHLSEPNRKEIRPLGRVTVKGKARPMGIYLSALPGLHPTLIRGAMESTIGGAIDLELIYRDQTYHLTSSASAMVLGRHQECDLIVQHEYVSRRHATMECRRGKFFITDHSSNGSYISDKEQQTFFLRRDMMQLRDNGSISLGIEAHKQWDHIIHYRLKLYPDATG